MAHLPERDSLAKQHGLPPDSKFALAPRLLQSGLVLILIATWLAGVSLPGLAQQVTGERIEHAEQEPQNWLTFFGNYRGWSYSPLKKITRANVKQLLPAWSFALGGFGEEAAPLVADGVLYIEDQENNVFALNATTGKLLWRHHYEMAKWEPPRGGKARGLAIGYGLIFLGTNDNHMLALDAKTGEQVWNVEIEPSNKCGCRITSAPLLVKDKVISGVTGGENAHRGYLNAFDAKTGKQVWRFYTIPAPGEPGSETWAQDSWRFGGGSTWYTGTYDPELNLLYWGIGNPSSDFYGEHRAGANLYTDSLVALDPDTGKLKWYFQEIPHDVNDYDANHEPILIDAQSGPDRKLVLHSNKGGFAYLLNRETGKLVRAFPYADNITWTKGLDKNGKPIDPMIPGKDKNFVFCPGTAGARNRNHGAYSPQTGWWYTTSMELCSQIMPEKQTPPEGGRWFGGDRTMQLSKTSQPHISAFDPLTGERRWTFNTHYLNASSLLVTAGDLLFGGDLEGEAFALDARTGKKLWSFNTGVRIVSPPVSFSVNGRQYIAISAGGGTIAERDTLWVWPEAKDHLPPETSMLFVFALPER